jgi:hypothetical protein
MNARDGDRGKLDRDRSGEGAKEMPPWPLLVEDWLGHGPTYGAD